MFFLLAFLSFFFCLRFFSFCKSSSRSGRSKVTRVTVGHDTDQSVRVCKDDLATLKVAMKMVMAPSGCEYRPCMQGSFVPSAQALSKAPQRRQFTAQEAVLLQHNLWNFLYSKVEKPQPRVPCPRNNRIRTWRCFDPREITRNKESSSQRRDFGCEDEVFWEGSRSEARFSKINTFALIPFFFQFDVPRE